MRAGGRGRTGMMNLTAAFSQFCYLAWWTPYRITPSKLLVLHSKTWSEWRSNSATGFFSPSQVPRLNLHLQTCNIYRCFTMFSSVHAGKCRINEGIRSETLPVLSNSLFTNNPNILIPKQWKLNHRRFTNCLDNQKQKVGLSYVNIREGFETSSPALLKNMNSTVTAEQRSDWPMT